MELWETTDTFLNLFVLASRAEQTGQNLLVAQRGGSQECEARDKLPSESYQLFHSQREAAETLLLDWWTCPASRRTNVLQINISGDKELQTISPALLASSRTS